MKIPEIERMSPVQRRRFLKILGVALAAPAVPSSLRFACNELAGGKAYAQDAEDSRGTYFIEINFRDQWDQGHVFVAPGLATYSGLRKGENGSKCALFFTQDQLVQRPNNVYLTNDSMALDPHLDTVAMIDGCVPSRGAIHGHEAANEVRSPGRTYTSGNGRMAMYENDPVSNFPQGCEQFYSSTPTPASLHNYHQKSLDPTLRNGIAFKGISRSIHTSYHFGAGLAGAELDRIRSKDELFGAFPAVLENVNVLATPEEADAYTRILDRVDQRFLSRRHFATGAIEEHRAHVLQSRDILYVREPRLVSLPLSAEEEAYWSPDVPSQMCTSGDVDSFECNDDTVKAQIWEQCAYAAKILASGITRSIALEFDYMDLHGFRPEIAVRTQAKQAAIPIARLIQSLKDAGIYDRTLIAAYTTDGSRSPAANSYGDGGKNTLLLAGGMIRGGYYGDIRVAGDDGDGHRYTFRMPDVTTGALGTEQNGTEGRLPSASVWRTVMKALQIPDALADSFPDAAGARPLSFLLRS